LVVFSVKKKEWRLARDIGNVTLRIIRNLDGEKL
jgi:hypothetical protein